MAETFNLIPCDEGAYSAKFNRYSGLPLPASGTTVEFDTLPNEYYTIERNNQAFFPYPTVFGDGASYLFTITSFEIDGEELIGAPVLVSSTGEASTGILANLPAPFLYPANYDTYQLKNAKYVTGTTYKKGLTDALQNILNVNNVNNVLTTRTSVSTPTFSGTSVIFQNYVIHKPETVSIVLKYVLTIAQPLSGTTSFSIDILFSGATVSYKVDGVETPILGNSAQSYVTTDASIVAYPFLYNSFQEVECPCELCDNCYLLTDCSDPSIWMQSYADLSANIGDIIELEGVDGCWKVEECPDKILVVVKDSFATCKACQPKCNTPKCK